MAGGSQIIINAEGIKIITPAKFEAKAQQHLFKTGEKVTTHVPVLPKANNSNWIALEHLNAENEPFPNLGYKLFFAGNQIIEGKLDEHGKAYHENVPEKAIKVEYEQCDYKDSDWEKYDLVLDQLNKLKE